MRHLTSIWAMVVSCRFCVWPTSRAFPKKPPAGDQIKASEAIIEFHGLVMISMHNRGGQP